MLVFIVMKWVEMLVFMVKTNRLTTNQGFTTLKTTINPGLLQPSAHLYRVIGAEICCARCWYWIPLGVPWNLGSFESGGWV